MSQSSVDVIGLELDEARRRLEAAGITVVVVETRPPLSGVVLSGPPRVVRQRSVGPDRAELTVTPERYDPDTLRPGSTRSARSDET